MAKGKTEEKTEEKIENRREARIYVSRLLKVGREVKVEEESDDTIAVHIFQTEPASVRIAKGMTINMGKFQSARFDCAVSYPCYAEQVPDVYDMVDRFVEDRLTEEAEGAKRYFDGLGEQE